MVLLNGLFAFIEYIFDDFRLAFLRFKTILITLDRSNHQRSTMQKVFWKISQNYRKTPVSESLFSTVAGLIFKNTYFCFTPLVAVSAIEAFCHSFSTFSQFFLVFY